MKRLLGFILPAWRRVLLSVLLGAGTVAASIGLLGASAWLISAAALQPSIAELQVAIVGVRFFGISRGVLRYLERLVAHDTTFRLLGRIRSWFYRAVEPLAPAGLTRLRAGDLLTRSLADIDSLENFYVRALAPPLVALVIVGSVSLWIGAFDPRLGLVLLAFLLLGGAALPAAATRLGCTPGRELVASQAALRAETVDALQGMPELLLYGGMAAQQRRLGAAAARLRRAQRRMAVIASWNTVLTSLFTHLCVLALLFLSIPLVRSGRIDGVFLAVILLSALASFEAVGGLPQAAQYLESNRAAARRLFEVADATPPVIDPPQPQPIPAGTGIFLHDLGFSYAPQLPPALQGISLDLPPGAHVAVTGPSGAGKSTLVNLLLRFQDCPPDSILLDGQDVRACRAEAVRGSFSTMLQDAFIFHGTLRQNLLLAEPDAAEDVLWVALAHAGLDEMTAALPQGLDTLVGEGGRTLSVGERQRLALARALLRRGRLYIFDEPTANIDPLREHAVVHACLEALRGCSVLWITHRLVGMELMDEIIVLDGGRIVQRGSHIRLLGEDGLYRQLWEMQQRFLDEIP